MNDLQSRLREVMTELELESASDLAKFCKVSEGLVSQWFAGSTRLGPKPLKAFSRTQFSLDWLTDGRLPKYRPASSSAAPLVQLVAEPDHRIAPDELRKWMDFFLDTGSAQRPRLISAVESLIARQEASAKRNKL